MTKEGAVSNAIFPPVGVQTVLVIGPERATASPAITSRRHCQSRSKISARLDSMRYALFTHAPDLKTSHAGTHLGARAIGV